MKVKPPVEKPLPFVSVIVPTHNSWETLQRSLGGLLQQSYPSQRFEVIVVDDGSMDGTAKKFGDLALSRRFRYLRQPNRGPASARNRGIRAARGEILLFVDDDVVPGPGLVKEHVLMHRRFPNAFVQGKVTLDSLTSRADAARFATLHEFNGKDGQLLEYFSVSWNLSVKRAHLEQAGLFNEAFDYPAFEDFDLGFRLVKHAGLELRYAARALARHRNRSDFRMLLRKRYEQGKSFMRFVRLHPSALEDPTWPKCLALWRQALAGALSFSPVSFHKIRRLQSAVRRHDRATRDSAAPHGLWYRKVNEYCFREGAFIALKNLRKEGPAMLQESFNPARFLNRIPVRFEHRGERWVFSDLLERMRANGFQINPPSRFKPCVRILREPASGFSDESTHIILYRGFDRLELDPVPLEGVGEIWVPTTYAQKRVRTWARDLPVYVFAPGASIPRAFPLSPPPLELRRTFTLLAFAESKSTWKLLLEAFLLEFGAGENCALWLHTRDPWSVRRFLKSPAPSRIRKGRVVLCGIPAVTSEKLDRLWHADAYVHLDEEPYPAPVLLAMGLKKAVLASGTGGERDWITDACAYFAGSAHEGLWGQRLRTVRAGLRTIFGQSREVEKKREAAHRNFRKLTSQKSAEPMMARLWRVAGQGYLA